MRPQRPSNLEIFLIYSLMTTYFKYRNQHLAKNKIAKSYNTIRVRVKITPLNKSQQKWLLKLSIKSFRRKSKLSNEWLILFAKPIFQYILSFNIETLIFSIKKIRSCYNQLLAKTKIFILRFKSWNKSS